MLFNYLLARVAKFLKMPGCTRLIRNIRVLNNAQGRLPCHGDVLSRNFMMSILSSPSSITSGEDRKDFHRAG